MDIIFFAALAIYIFFKLSKELGKVDEEEKNNIQEAVAKRKEKLSEIQNQIVENAKKQIIEVIATKSKIEEEILSNLSGQNREIFITALQRSNISAEFFLNGAKSAFEMILKSFAEGNLETLKFLLSDKIYQDFESAIKQRNSENKKLVTNLIAIEEAKILSAQIHDNIAFVTVSFSSKQINYLENSASEILEGKKDEIAQISDIWTFRRDLNSSNPNWNISATSNS
jgi:predicted lipid-binding transport protein (Tim44 family)